jgi:hypothetical protein
MLWNNNKQYYGSKKAKFARKKEENLSFTELNILFGGSRFLPEFGRPL